MFSKRSAWAQTLPSALLWRGSDGEKPSPQQGSAGRVFALVVSPPL